MATETIKETIRLYEGEEEIVFYPNSHQYRRGGKRLLSVTGISGIIDKSTVLKIWAANLSQKYFFEHVGKKLTNEMIKEGCWQFRQKQDEALNIGKQVHKFCEEYGKAIITGGEKPDVPEDDQISNGVLGFLKWIDENDIEFLEVERMVYSRKYNFVGTFDILIKMDGKTYLCDYKTSKAIYHESHLQLSGYQMAWEEETKKNIDGRFILRFDKETGEFEVIEGLDKKDVFLNALELKKFTKEKI